MRSRGLATRRRPEHPNDPSNSALRLLINTRWHQRCVGKCESEISVVLGLIREGQKRMFTRRATGRRRNAGELRRFLASAMETLKGCTSLSKSGKCQANNVDACLLRNGEFAQ